MAVTHLNRFVAFARRIEVAGMNEGRLIFTQVSDMIDRKQFERCVDLHPMPRASRSMTARDQFLAMLFAQLTFRESLRDI